jgi:pyruvate dehydrogenase E2 component (dihydrolipoamide acetyltransferase)
MAVPVVMPRLGDFMTEGVVASWAKRAGEHVRQDEVVAQIESEKVTYELEAVAEGIFHPMVAEGAFAPVDATIAYLLAEGETPPEESASKAPDLSATQPTPPVPPKPSERRSPVDVVPSTPSARRLAAKLGVDISQVSPTGPRGRVVEDDVRAHATREEDPAKSESTLPPGVPPPSKVVPMVGMRSVIAEHMRSSIATTAQLSYFLEVDVTEAQRLRAAISEDPETVVTIAHVLIKACAETLKMAPALNSILRDGKILYFDQIDIGVAVALDDGLIVPVLRDAGSMDIFQISNAVHELAVKAREGGLTPDGVVGSTFTISVLKSVDGFTPILNSGQSAILGVGRTVEKPVARNGEIAIREMITLSLTADHQVIDGAVAAGFLQHLQEALECPAALFEPCA